MMRHIQSKWPQFSNHRMCKLIGIIFVAGLYISAATVKPTMAQFECCQPGKLFNPDTEACAAVNDVRKHFLVWERSIETPDLKELRSKQSQNRSAVPSNMPPPGGIGAGTTYQRGGLRALNEAELYTKMFVQPDGINPSNMNLRVLYTTATNRVEKNVEVVGMYNYDKSGRLGVYDWSCSESDPCQGGETSPSWIWTRQLSSLPCNMSPYVDQGKHLQFVMPYINESIKIDQGDPPLWRNSVYLWNYCNDVWDLVYEHQYRVSQKNCSDWKYECSWWGPILEDFNDGGEYPRIKELGFEDTVLTHDGIRSELGPNETDFDHPVSPWNLYHIDENRGFGIGNQVSYAVDYIFAVFTANPLTGPNPLQVTFKDESIGDIASWEWNFGDDSPIGTDQNPTHTYAEFGLYSVSLTVTGSNGSHTETKTDYISVTCPAGTYTISGEIVDSDGRLIPDAVIFSYDPQKFVLTNYRGYYEFPVCENWSGVINFRKSGYSFTPLHYSYTGIAANKINQDATGKIAPHIPTPVAPADGQTIATLTPTFEWSAFEDGGNGATQAGYWVRVRCVDDNDEKIYDTKWIEDTSAHSHTYQTGAFDTSEPLEDGKHYRWNVRYQDSTGARSEFSGDFPDEHQDLYIDTTPGLYTISGHLLDSAGLPIESASAFSYDPEKYVFSDSDGYYQFTVAKNSSGFINFKKSGIRFSPPNLRYTDISTDQTHQDAIGQIAPHIPTPIAPADEETISTVTPTFKWSAFEDGGNGTTQVGYWVRVRCVEEDDIKIYDTKFIADTNANSHTYQTGAFDTSDPLQDGKHYRWNVRYRDSNGIWGEFSGDFPDEHQDFYVEVPAPNSCLADFDKDGDVDGDDLFALIKGGKAVTHKRFAEEFCRTDCD